MKAQHLIQMVDATFIYFKSLTSWHKDPDSLQAVSDVRDSMTRDLESFSGDLSPTDLIELCQQWRALRIEMEDPATYAPDMFIESICQVIAIS